MSKGNIRTIEDFKKELNKTNKYYRENIISFVEDSFKNMCSRITVITPYGKCKRAAYKMYGDTFPTIRTAINKTEYIKNKLLDSNEHYRKGEFKLIGEYVHIDKKIKTKDKYGYCLSNLNILLSGCNTTIRTAIDKHQYFLNMLLDKNEDYKNKKFEVVDTYKRSDVKIKLKDRYGYLVMKPASLLLNKGVSIDSAVSKKDYYIEKVKENRPDFDEIDYSLIKYTKSTSKTKFICKVHNHIYKQSIIGHQAGKQGCEYCNFNIVEHEREDVLILSEGIKGFLYVLNMHNEEEDFYKVGFTRSSIKNRISFLPKVYKIDIVYYERKYLTDVLYSEDFLLSKFKHKKYVPKINFNGVTECLSINPIDEIMGYEEEYRRREQGYYQNHRYE